MTTRVAEIPADVTEQPPLPSSDKQGGRGFARDVVTLVSGNALAQVIVVAVSPAMTRLYTPESYATLALFTSIVTVTGLIACLRYEVAIMLPREEKETANLLVLCLLASVGVAATTGMLIALFSGSIVNALNAPDLRPFVWLVAPMVFFSGVFTALNHWFSRKRRFGSLSLARIVGTVGNTVYPLAAGLVGYASSRTLIGGCIGGMILPVLVLFGRFERSELQLFWHNVRASGVWRNSRRYVKFPLVDSWGILLNTISWQLPVWMLSSFFSQDIVGYYALANRFVQMPMWLAGSAITQVFFQRVSGLYHHGEDVSSIVKSTLERLSALGLFPALVAGLVGRDLFTIVFGSQWSEAGTYTQILSLWVFVWFISSPLSALFSVLERQELLLVIQIFVLVTRFVSLWIGGWLGSVYLALGLFAGTGIVVYGGLLVWSIRLVNIPFGKVVSIISRCIRYAIPAILILVPIKLWADAPSWLVLLASLSAIMVYYGLSMRYDRTLFSAFVGRESL